MFWFFLHNAFFPAIPSVSGPFFQTVDVACHMLGRFEVKSETKWGLDGFNVYDKKAIFLLMALSSITLLYPTGSVLNGSVECFAGRDRTCHVTYDSIADTGEFWVTVLIMYFISLLTFTVGYMGLLLRRNMQ